MLTLLETNPGSLPHLSTPIYEILTQERELNQIF